MSARTVALLRREAQAYRDRALHARANARLMFTQDVYDDILLYARKLEQKSFVLEARAALLEQGIIRNRDLTMEVKGLIESARRQLEEIRAALRRKPVADSE